MAWVRYIFICNLSQGLLILWPLLSHVPDGDNDSSSLLHKAVVRIKWIMHVICLILLHLTLHIGFMFFSVSGPVFPKFLLNPRHASTYSFYKLFS